MPPPSTLTVMAFPELLYKTSLPVLPFVPAYPVYVCPVKLILVGVLLPSSIAWPVPDERKVISSRFPNGSPVSSQSNALAAVLFDIVIPFSVAPAAVICPELAIVLVAMVHADVSVITRKESKVLPEASNAPLVPVITKSPCVAPPDLIIAFEKSIEKSFEFFI